jgi:hypothetical protein
MFELSFFWSFVVGASCGMVAGLVFDKVFPPKA